MTVCLFVAGLLHFGILIASALVPQVLDWRRDLAKLHPLTRNMIWVHGAYIVFVIVAFGALATLQPAALADGSPLSRLLCGVIAMFWGLGSCCSTACSARPDCSIVGGCGSDTTD